MKKESKMCNANRKQKWTHELRVIVFSAIMKEFGEYNSFDGYFCPKGESQKLNELLEKLQVTLKIISENDFSQDAIKQQIAFAITKQDSFNSKGHVYNWILNTAAALEAGYITSNILPDVTLSEKKVKS